jgi:hypothetical protein
MRHIQTFKVFESSQELSPRQEAYLDGLTTGPWKLNRATGLVDIKGSFYYVGNTEGSFDGIKFGTVTGSFTCDNNDLKTLEGAPRVVERGFGCSTNRLKSLKGGPERVGEDFYCNNNNLTDLTGSPDYVGGSFACIGNPLESFEGAPKFIGEKFYYRSYVAPFVKLEIPAEEWNLIGLLRIYAGSDWKVKRLIRPLVSAEAIQQEIDQNPEKMAVELKGVLKDLLEIPEYQNLKFPENLRREADLMSDLSGIGL